MDCSQEKILQDQYPFHKACRDGDLNFLDRSLSELMKEHPNNSVLLQEDNFYGWAPIHWAAYYGQNQVLIGLIKMGIDKNLKTSEHEQTPAHLAAFGSHPDTIMVLNEANANLNAKDHLLETPLHKAVRSGNSQVVSVLLKCGVDVSIRNSSHNLAIDLATTHQHSQCYLLLQTYNQQVANTLSHTDDTHQLNGFGSCYRKRFHENDSGVSAKRAKTSCEELTLKTSSNILPKPLISCCVMDEVTNLISHQQPAKINFKTKLFDQRFSNF